MIEHFDLAKTYRVYRDNDITTRDEADLLGVPSEPGWWFLYDPMNTYAMPWIGPFDTESEATKELEEWTHE